jgi:hypothetical protein
MKSVRYELKINGLQSRTGTISIRALRDIADRILECSERGLRLALQGESVVVGRIPQWLTDSLDVTVTGLKRGSTRLVLEAPPLGETAPDRIRQPDLWYTTPSPDDTALTLLYKSVRDTTAENLESDTYDSGVLEGLLSFRSILPRTAQSIELTCLNRSEERFELGAPEIEKIERLKTHTPEPAAFVISGQLDMIAHSSKRFLLRVAASQAIPGTIDEKSLNLENMREFWGKKVTVKGTVYFRPSGSVRLVEAQMIKVAEIGEEVFEKLPSPRYARELFEALPKPAVARESSLTAIWGQWPGDEPIDELLALLRETRRENG